MQLEDTHRGTHQGTDRRRTAAEIAFLFLFYPTLVVFYLIYKYPAWFVAPDKVASTFYWFHKSTSFWYSTVYTAVVCFFAGRVLLRGHTPYGRDKTKPLSPYQRKKFTSIFFAQLVFFYLIPYFVPVLLHHHGFADTYEPVNKNAYIYVYNGFTSMSGFAYIFLVVPASVWFFGKRYCSWFCACGNLAETIGVTSWGNRWVTQRTPRSDLSRKLEWLQYALLAFAILFGLVLFLQAWKILVASSLVTALRQFQDLAIDLIFGALIGLGAYPFLGTRVWCRYGCPLAASMRVFGKFSKSRFQVVANDRCKGLNLCSTQCPMGIDVASYAHENGVAIQGRFGLQNSPCIGCGGCIDICPVQALTFQKILNGERRL